MTSATDPGNKSPDEIQRELEDERRRLRETGRSLQDRLTLGSIIDEVLSRSRERGPEYAGSLGRTIRDNPIPVALIGVCVAWLMAGGQRASEERFRHGRGYGRALDLEEEEGYPRPTRPVPPPPPPSATGPAVTDPVARPMAGPPHDRPRSTAPYAPPPPSPLAGEMSAGHHRPRTGLNEASASLHTDEDLVARQKRLPDNDDKAHGGRADPQR